MLKLSKYILRFWFPILLVAGLLFGQSQAELALPDYMSEIVSTGIQSHGFKGSVSDVLSVETYNDLVLVASDDEKKVIESSYDLVAYNDLDKEVKDTFTNIEGKDLYIIKELDSTQHKELEDALIRPMLVFSMVESMDKQSSEYKEMFGMLPEGVTPYQGLAMMPADAKAEFNKEIDTQIETLGESNVLVATSNSLKLEYESLGGNVSVVQNNYIFSKGLEMLGLALLGSIAAILVSLISSRIGAKLARDVRKDVFKKVESFSNQEFNSISTASLITRTTNDITQIQTVMTMVLRIVCYAPMLGIGALIKALNQSPSMTWIIIVVLLFMFCVIAVTFALALPKFKVIQSLIDKLNLTTRENLTGMLVIRAFGNEKYSEDRFDDANQTLTKTNLFVNRVMSGLMPIMMFGFNVVTLLIIWFGGQQIDLGNLDIGQVLAFMQYAMQIIMGFLMITIVAVMLPRATVAAHRVHEVLSITPQIVDPQTPKEFLENQKGVVEFDNVTFKYPGANEAVLSDISFVARPGKTTAFIGSTGSGKSTLINLVPRFYEVTSGSVKVSGVDVRDVNQFDLRERIGLVPQKGNLFTGTIKSNLLYGTNEASDEYLDRVIEISQAKEFVETKEDGMESSISQGGTNVSGGQRQRLAIARALTKNPEVLIFDDSFSALDFKTDAKLRQELQVLMAESKNTVLLVGQRIASIMSADQIIVLDKGKMVGIGTHDELMKNCSVYQEIAYSQLSKEELENE